ncbi:hypothetical protein EVAR_92124_1 [Eumeta japonica]|uniref:Uncharacterized protein n=1 Tax=Eumeta variegata TaxID=151549 RepID=A0A4C1SZB5_EUMVA|nr:hypothetical protein EVAR_92124_1 [Eumeta japonica]
MVMDGTCAPLRKEKVGVHRQQFGRLRVALGVGRKARWEDALEMTLGPLWVRVAADRKQWEVLEEAFARILFVAFVEGASVATRRRRRRRRSRSANGDGPYQARIKLLICDLLLLPHCCGPRCRHLTCAERVHCPDGRRAAAAADCNSNWLLDAVSYDRS